MEFSMDSIASDCIKAINEKIRSLNTLNIIVAGKTGVGKSTLINGVFRESLAETGIGKPVTQHMRKISKAGFPLNIYDTKGFELGKNAQKEVKDEIVKTIKEGLAAKDVNQVIHCIWYCINTGSNRIEPEEIEWLKTLAEENKYTQVPIIIVLTQAFSKKQGEAMKKMILDENLDVINVIPVLAADYEIDDEMVIKSYGLDTLIEVMTEALPEEMHDTLMNIQKVSLAGKKRRAHQAVAAATAAAFGEGFAPIPFADSALLIPTQVTMIASITAIFGLDINKSVITAFVSSTIGTGGATIIGKTVASNLLKLVPGAGTVLGGTISGATAGVITTALGEAYILFMEAVYKGEINSSEIGTKEGKAKLKGLFKSRLKARKNKKNGQIDVIAMDENMENPDEDMEVLDVDVMGETDDKDSDM